MGLILPKLPLEREPGDHLLALLSAIITFYFSYFF